MRTIIIGDVHGCFDEVQDLLRKTGFTPTKDRLIFVGDLINKGPKSLEVLQFVRSNNYEAVMGNHELGFLKYLETGKTRHLGFETLAGEMQNAVEDWAQWIAALPPFIEEKDFLVVHGGLIPGEHPSKSDMNQLARIRTWDGKGLDLNNPNHKPWFEFYTDTKLVVFGHWALRGLVKRPNAIGLDTGCVYGKELSAVILPEKKIVSVKAKKVYQSL